MVETDWKEILSFSQRELIQADKDKLCESLSWMEADDIELNFTDLKSLFRLAQDILKYKSEQVNNLMGELEKGNKKSSKVKHRTSDVEISTRPSDGVLETINSQHREINSNKEILRKLNLEIEKLEERKKYIKHNKADIEEESESSRDPLSEINAAIQLEKEVFKKNRHIRKLLTDVKLLEEENVKLKEKLSELKDKLKEATQLIENLTERLFSSSSECNQLKETLGNCEQTKISLLAEVDSLNKELCEKTLSKGNPQENVRSKLQHLKNSLKSHKRELELLTTENMQLKEKLIFASKPTASPKKEIIQAEEVKNKQLQDKLIEASNKIEESANLIQLLKTENKRLKSVIDDGPDLSLSENKNESDDGKERNIIKKLTNKLKNVTVNLQATEEMVTIREKELAEMTSTLQQVQSEEGINLLLKDLKNKNRQLRFKDLGIKNFVMEINNLNLEINKLQLENEILRQELNVPPQKKIPTHGILKKYQDMEKKLVRITKEFRKIEDRLITIEMDNRVKNSKISKLHKLLHKLGYNYTQINKVLEEYTEEEDSEEHVETLSRMGEKVTQKSENILNTYDPEIQAIVKENEGLRIGLQEILNFLKDNSTTSSGILSLKCPSLEAICHSMDARHAAGWFAPHMTTLMDLKAALGGRDALLDALHDSRKETFEIMTQLSKESKKSSELEEKLVQIESCIKEGNSENHVAKDIENNVFSNSLIEIEPNNIDYNDEDQIKNMFSNANIKYEYQLKSSLKYFQEKFRLLHEKFTSLTITTADNHNKWLIQEENYKAEIESLKSQLLQNTEDDTRIQSPGLLSNLDVTIFQRKYSYLEDLYKEIRTRNENIKNEYVECKREMMIMASDYEIHIQSLIISNINIADKLRRCVPADLFWKQNVALNELIVKYRNAAEAFVSNNIEENSILKRLQEDKVHILSYIQQELKNISEKNENEEKQINKNLEIVIYERQLGQLSLELQNKNVQIEVLNRKNEQLQLASVKIIDSLTSNVSKEDNILEKQIYKLREENKIFKQENHRIRTQLDVTLLKLQENQQHKISTDTEINLLRHQILDLQSTGDNKAIIARLSGEILIAHLQTSENINKIERLTLALNREKHMRVEAENRIETRQKVMDYYITSNENKLRNMFEILQVFRDQYQGSLPLCTIESYLTKLEEINHKTHSVNKKLDEIEDVRLNLMTKHSVYNQILETAQMQRLRDENKCGHKLKNFVAAKIQTHELDLCNKKIQTLERSRKEILERCNFLEHKLLVISQGHKISIKGENKPKNTISNKNKHSSSCSSLELQDLSSEDEDISTKSGTFTLSRSKLVKPLVIDDQTDRSGPHNNDCNDNIHVDDIDHIGAQRQEFVNVSIQTNPTEEIRKFTKTIQTDEDPVLKEIQFQVNNLKMDIKSKTEISDKFMVDIQRLTQNVSIVNEQKHLLERTVQNLTDSHNQKDNLIKTLQFNIDTLKSQFNELKTFQRTQMFQEKKSCSEENRTLLQTLNDLENEKHSIVTEYKELLKREREEYAKSIKDLQAKILDAQSQLDKRATDADIISGDVNKEPTIKYILKITELDDKCFKLQSKLDGYKTEIITCQSELDRWKDLANERLLKMEHLSAQLKERHNEEMESYKAENEHWLAQLNETQREHMDLRSRLTEQKALYIKQLADKDAHIEQLRTVVHNLKTQIMNMQTMLSINDPSFDLSAIVEVEEASDAVSPQGSERLELKFESVVDLQDFQEDYMKMPTTSTAIWQEPLIERLRREKQLIGKQNAILRRQIKAVAARERRARIDAQNLKNQVFRITTSGNKVATVESAALLNKIATLQAQLTSARRDAHSSVAIWDKWKRAQQLAERWQSRYEEKCQEEKKLETSLQLSKSAISRLEKEKRVLLSRLSDVRNERCSIIEKQDDEQSEKRTRTESDYTDVSPAPVSTRALLDRIQAQQRRIAALEVAEKGNEPLVSEYEKGLAEITSLKGQVLKLESTLLESQIRIPLNPSNDTQPELEYWKSYCDMLKEENMQLTLRVNSVDITPASAHQQRINDLEQTVLTLRGLVSKLQADQKSGSTIKRVDSRPSSGRNTTDKIRNQMDSYRTEISNLKRTIQEKDMLLERSKEMLKIAAEREDELLQENALLRQRVDELVELKGSFLPG